MWLTGAEGIGEFKRSALSTTPLIQQTAIIETENVLQRQCNPRCQTAITFS